MRTIEIKIIDEIITALREANDPNGEIWKSNEDMTEEDIATAISDILTAWVNKRGIEL